MTMTKPFDISKREVWLAFKRVKANQGAAGVDGQSIAAFEERLADNLYKLWNRLSSGSYFPPPVRRVDIPQMNGPRRQERALSAFRPSKQTTHKPNPTLGWVTFVHPYHPLRNQRFEVLKQRRVGGVETLIIHHAELGSYAVARSWTDWAGTPLDENPVQAVSFDALRQLSTLLAAIKKPKGA